MLKKIVILIIAVLLPLNMNGEEHEMFSQMMCEIISQSSTVKECTYDRETASLIIHAQNGKDKKVLCLWFAQNENNEITINSKRLLLKHGIDYVLVGYGQSPSNPKLYYYIPIKKVCQMIKLNRMEKYMLSWPIVENKF